MKVFIAYADGDEALARGIAEGLMREGLDVWYDQFEVFSGDNWAETTAKALNECESMVVLYTSRAGSSEAMWRNVAFALGNPHYRERVIPVLIGAASPDTVPGPLRKRQVRLSDLRNLEAAGKAIASALPLAA